MSGPPVLGLMGDDDAKAPDSLPSLTDGDDDGDENDGPSPEVKAELGAKIRVAFEKKDDVALYDAVCEALQRGEG